MLDQATRPLMTPADADDLVTRMHGIIQDNVGDFNCSAGIVGRKLALKVALRFFEKDVQPDNPGCEWDCTREVLTELVNIAEGAEPHSAAEDAADRLIEFVEAS